MAAYIFNRPKDIAYYTVYCKATTAKMYTASITKKVHIVTSGKSVHMASHIRKKITLDFVFFKKGKINKRKIEINTNYL